MISALQAFEVLPHNVICYEFPINENNDLFKKRRPYVNTSYLLYIENFKEIRKTRELLLRAETLRTKKRVCFWSIINAAFKRIKTKSYKP